MAKKFLTGLTLVNLPSDPSVGSEGELYFNTSASVARIYKSGTWADLDTVGGGSLSQEQVQDYVAPLFTSATNTNVIATYDDANNVINLNTSGSLISVDSIVYPDYIVFDTTPETSSASTGTIFWDSGDGLPKVILGNGVELGIGQEEVALVKNATGSSIDKGKVVYISGAQGQRPTITLSDADTENTSSKTFGVTAQSIADGAEGFVTTFGILRGVNTNGLTEGGAIWLSQTAGDFTQTIPAEPAHAVFIGYVVKAHASSGEIFINIQNGYELNEIHGVLINGVSDNQALVYNSSASLWYNESIVNSLTGTGNQIDISASVGNVTLSLPNDLITPGDLTVTGNLTVSGSTTYINTQTLNVEDNIILLNSNVTGAPTGTAGIEIERGTSPNTYVLWDESTQTWRFSDDIQAYALRSQNVLQLDVSASAGSSGEIDLTTTFAEININTDGSIDIRPGDISGLNMYKFSKTYLQFPDTTQQNTAFLGMSSYSTTNLSEGTNLYFTDARARTALSADLGGTNGGIRIIAPSGIADATLSNDSATRQVIVGPSASVTSVKGSLSVLTSPSIGDSGNLTVAGSITGSSIVKDGGTSSQFLKADGSIDSSTYLTTETDPVFSASDAASITSGNISNWNTAYGWGNHASAGYLTSYTETDPVFSASDAASITSASISNWNTAYGWGNHATAGYLTSYTETDTLENVTDRGATSSNAISITNATAASSPITGALIVSGGVGIGEDLYVNNDVHIGGDIHITGSISGSLTYVNVSDLVVTDPLIYLAESNPNDSVDIGIFAALNHSSSAYYHTGLIRDASDSGKWKLASNLLDPINNVIDFTGATFDTLKIGALEVTDASTTRTNLGLAIGTNVQAYNSTLAAVAGGTYTGDDSITTVGTIAAGTWNGSTIGYAYGGTGLTTLGTAGQVLTVNAGATAIEWATPSGGGGGGLTTTTTSITTNSATAIESFAIATSRTAEALIQITQGTDYYCSKVVLIHDGTTVKMTEYAILESTTGAIPLTISAAISGSNLELRATITDAATTNATAKVVLIEVAV